MDIWALTPGTPHTVESQFGQPHWARQTGRNLARHNKTAKKIKHQNRKHSAVFFFLGNTIRFYHGLDPGEIAELLPFVQAAATERIFFAGHGQKKNNKSKNSL
jgi:hypothetical protein